METNEEVNNLKEILDDAGEFEPIQSPGRRWLKDKDGNKLTFGEFMAIWKDGMKGITQYQQTKMQLNSTYIMLFGVFCGFVITLTNLKTLWWLSIILGAAFFNTFISALGLWQKKLALGEFEKIIHALPGPEREMTDGEKLVSAVAWGNKQ